MTSLWRLVDLVNLVLYLHIDVQQVVDGIVSGLHALGGGRWEMNLLLGVVLVGHLGRLDRSTWLLERSLQVFLLLSVDVFIGAFDVRLVLSLSIDVLIRVLLWHSDSHNRLFIIEHFDLRRDVPIGHISSLGLTVDLFNFCF